MTSPADALDRRVACPHATTCGGCPLIDSTLGEQLVWKHARVVEALAAYADRGVHASIEPTVAANAIERYRRRAKLIAASPARLGLFARDRDHEVVDIPECRVLTPALADAVAKLRRSMTGTGGTVSRALRPLDPGIPVASRGWLRAVDLREARAGGTSQLLVTVVLDGAARANEREIGEAARAVADAVGPGASVAVSFHEGASPQVLGRDLGVRAGEAAVRDELDASGTFQLASHGAFVQAHGEQAGRIAELVRREIAGALGSLQDARVLDLYGGSGALGLMLAARGARVTLVESFLPAVARARQAAAAQGLDHFEALSGDAGQVTHALAADRARFDAVVVNPPRRGIAPIVRESIARLAPRLVAYVSCDPETLARDLSGFAVLGFGARRVVPYDMMPLTEEVETVAILAPAPVPAPRVLFENAEIVAVEKAPHEPTIPHPEHPGSLLARVKRLPGCERAAAIHRLDAGTSGVVLFARTPEHVARWAAALGAAGAVKEYRAAVRGIVRPKGSISRDVVERGRRSPARSRYRREAIVAGHSLVIARPDQGRTHQIRQHLAAIAHPVLGDARYGHEPSNRHAAERYGLDRTFLHCARIELDDPTNGERLAITCPLAPDLAAPLARMRMP